MSLQSVPKLSRKIHVDSVLQFTQLTMPRFEVKQSAKLDLTSYSGLALIGQCCQAAQVEAVIDPKLPVLPWMKTSDLVKAMVGLLALG
jgi:hypothetical protein